MINKNKLLDRYKSLSTQKQPNCEEKVATWVKSYEIKDGGQGGSQEIDAMVLILKDTNNFHSHYQSLLSPNIITIKIH